MRTYGLDKGDRGCCAGHDKYPHPKEYVKKPPNFRRKNRAMKKRARRIGKEVN